MVGPSGIGKSSAVRAGLVPMLRGGAVPGSDRWVVTNMLPGSHPFVELRRAIERVAVDMPPSLGESLAAHRLDALADVDAALPGAAELLVVVDQFEELFTLTSEAEAAAFMRLLLHATEHGQARFVVTMRADFLDRPLLYSAFGELLGDHLLTVAAPTKDELTEAITRPPGALGVSVDGVLVDRIANDVHDRPGSLPLLQHAMTELFAARTTDRLEAASYEAIGGVAGSLARRAETTFAALESAEQHALHQALLRLVTVADDAAPTRRRVRLSELDNLGAGNGIEAFMRARLLVGDTDPDTRTPTVELAHEALIDHWPRLAGWIDDVRDDLTQSRRLDEAVVEWQASGEADDFLLTSGRLAQHTAWSDESMLTLTPTEHEYLRRSRRHDDDLRTRRRRRRSVVIGVLIALTVASSAFAAIAIRNGRMANEEARRARAEAFAQGAAAVLDRDPELAVMLGIQAVELNADSQSATRALNRAVQAHRTIYQPPAPPPDEERALSASISPDGELLAVSNWERLRVWEVGATDEPLWEWAGDDEEAVASVDFTVDGEHVVISNVLGDDQFCEQHTWRVLDARSGAEVASAVTPGLIPFDAGASQSGPYVDLDRPIVLASSGEIGSCFDLDSEVDLVAVGLLGGERDVIGLGANGAGERFIGVPTVDSSGARLATGGIGPGAVVDVATGEELLEIPPGMSTISPDGEQVIAGNDPLVLLDVETGATLREFQGEYRIAWFSPTGSMVYGGTLDGRLQVYDIETGRAIHTLSGSEADFRRVQMTDDESRIASIADDGTVRVWDIGSPIRGTAGPTEFRPDASGEEAVFFVTNTHVTSAGVLAARALTTGPATGEFGGAVQVPATTLYDLASGRELSTYPGLVVAVSADDRFVAYQETGPLVEHIEPGEDGDEDEAQQHVPYGRFQIADLATGLVPGVAGRALADLLDLVCQLPRPEFERVVDAQRDGGVRDQLLQIRDSSTLIPDAAHRRLARSLAWRAQWGAEDREPPEPDPMLERLVREALFHVDGRRRELAGRLVAATPYGPVLATHVVALTDDPRELLATRAWELVHVLGHGDAHRSIVARALDEQAPHRSEALLALGLSEVPLTPSESRAVAAVAAQSPDLRYAATLALGLASPGSLPALRGLDAVTDRAIDWWQRVGTAVVDRPM